MGSLRFSCPQLSWRHLTHLWCSSGTAASRFQMKSLLDATTFCKWHIQNAWPAQSQWASDPDSWVGKRGTFSALTANMSCGQVGTRRSKRSQSHSPAPAQLTSSPMVSRSDLELWGQLSSISQLCHAWWHLQQTSVLPTLKQKIPTILVAAERNTSQHFWFLRASKYTRILWPIIREQGKLLTKRLKDISLPSIMIPVILRVATLRKLFKI